MNTLRVIGLAVGAIKAHGKVAAMINRFKFDDGSELLASWGLHVSADLITLNMSYATEHSIPDCETAAELAFKEHSPELTRDDMNHPPLDSVVSQIVAEDKDGDLHVELFFTKPEKKVNFIIGRDEVPSFIGFTTNMLSYSGILDDVTAVAMQKMPPSSILLYTCEFRANGEIDYTNFAAYDLQHYKALPHLYAVSVADNTAGKKVIGGIFFKSSFTEKEQGFLDVVASVSGTLSSVATVDKKHISFITVRVNAPDNDPLTEKEMLNFLIEQYTSHTVGGSA